MIDKLRDLSATKFSDKMTGTQTLQVAVTSGDAHKVEKVTFNPAGDDYHAQRGDDPSVYVIAASSFNDLQSAIKGIKPYQPPKAAEKKK